MELDVKYKLVGEVDSSITDKIAEAFVEDDWYLYDYRRPMFDSARESGMYNSIMIRHSSEYSNDTIRNMPLYDKYYPLIEPILEELKKYYDYEEYVAFFARLQPEAFVTPHGDGGPFLQHIHRLHVPITTNDKSKYVIEEETMHWEIGKMYEFDNMRMHEAYNHGDTDRVHLIINLYPVGTLQMLKEINEKSI
jgi:hypothetical protein